MLALAVLALVACEGPPRDEAGAAPSDPQSRTLSVPAPQALSGDRLRLATPDGEILEIRLAEVRAPTDGEGAARAKAALAVGLAAAGDTLAWEDGPRDRHGRVVAHLTYDAGDGPVWMQGGMVREGWLMVASARDDHARTPVLLALEQEARATNRGGWGRGDFAVRGPEPEKLAEHLDSVQIIEGVVRFTGQYAQGRVFLNFGADWRTDFTVSVARAHIRAFEAAGISLLDLEGATVRVRGWLYEENGPMIALDHPQALEILHIPDAD